MLTLEDIRSIWWSRLVPKLDGYPDGGIWLWKGAKTTHRQSYKRGRNSQGLPYYYHASQPSTAVLKYKGQRHSVHRIAFLYHHPEMFEVERKWWLEPIGDRHDMNPANWKVVYAKELVFGETNGVAEDDIDAQYEAMMASEANMVQDCTELLDDMFSSGRIKTFNEVKSHVYMEDFDEATIRQALDQMGKGHIV